MDLRIRTLIPDWLTFIPWLADAVTPATEVSLILPTPALGTVRATHTTVVHFHFHRLGAVNEYILSVSDKGSSPPQVKVVNLTPLISGKRHSTTLDSRAVQPCGLISLLCSKVTLQLLILLDVAEG